MYFLWLLDAHNIDRAMGVPEDIFQELFYTCEGCGRYMTQRVSFNHREDNSEECSSDRYPCIYLRTGMERPADDLATTMERWIPFAILEDEI